MSPGTYISFTLHASLVGWLLFGGDFDKKPLELPVTEVSVISSEMFDIMLNNTVPIVDTELEVAVAQPVIEESQAPADPSIDVAPQRDTQVLRPITSNDALPQTVPDQPVRMEVVIIPPIDLPTPEIEANTPEPLETSLVPKLRPAPRIAPVAVAPTAPDLDIGELTRDAAAPQPEPAEVVKEQTAKAPESAAPEIVTVAEKPSEAVEVSRQAPPSSVRPQRRPAPRAPVVEMPTEKPAPVEPPVDPIAVALAEALSGQSADSGAQKVSPALEAAMNNAMQECNNRGALSSEAAAMTIVGGVNFTSNGRPVASTIKLLERKDGTKNNAKVRFEAYKRAALDSQCLNKMANVYKNAVQNGQIVEGQRWEFEIVPGTF